MRGRAISWRFLVFGGNMLVCLLLIVLLLGCKDKDQPEDTQQTADLRTDLQVSKPVKQLETQTVDNRIPLKVDCPELPSDSYDPYYANLAAARGKKLAEKPPTVLVPPDVTNVAKGKPVTSTDAMLILGELEYITDGDKRSKCYVEFEPKELPQHVTIDLEREYEIYAVVWWHCYDRAAIYWDVVVQVGRDLEFEDAVILFNNDHDGSLGLGKGTDLNYIETNEGWMARADGVVGRYVRLYNHTNSRNLINQYTEVEVYGRLKEKMVLDNPQRSEDIAEMYQDIINLRQRHLDNTLELLEYGRVGVSGVTIAKVKLSEARIQLSQFQGKHDFSRQRTK